MGTNNGTLGGGEILNYVGQNQQQTSYLNDDLIKQFSYLTWAKLAIAVLLLIIAAMIIMKILRVKSPFKGRAITNEFEHINEVKKHDRAILRSNKFIHDMTVFIEHSPFALDKATYEYMEYNLSRADVKMPGGNRMMKPTEFNALIKGSELFVVAIGLLLAFFVNAPIGVLLVIIAIISFTTLPMRFVRAAVRAKDAEIVNNFTDFYLMIHYTLLESAKTPLVGLMRSYDKTTDSDEMHRFVDVCTHYIDTYGDYDATRYISRQYREIQQVGKLMRLIRQANEGGDVRAELLGFRQELINQNKYQITKRMEKLVFKAKMSFNILMPVLIQAIISAMAIYIKDMGGLNSIIGG